MGSVAEVGKLAQMAPDSVDGEQLAVLRGILFQGVGRGVEERTPPIDALGESKGIAPAEIRELQEILLVEEKDLPDRGALIHRCARQLEGAHKAATAGETECVDDPAAGCDRLRGYAQPRTVRFHGENTDGTS